MLIAVAMKAGWLFPVAATVACVADLDTTRPEIARGTFGEIVYQEACQRVAYTSELEARDRGEQSTVDVSGARYRPVCSQAATPPAEAPAKLKALADERSVIVDAVDRILPKDFLGPFEQFLEAIGPLNDDGTVGDAIARAAALLGTMAGDRDVSRAFSRFSTRIGYRPAESGDLLQTVATYPGLDRFLGSTLDVLLDGDGQPTPELGALLGAVSNELGGVTSLADARDTKRTLALALGLLRAESLDFRSGTSHWLVERDVRGLARVAVAPPFVDRDRDGLADVDAEGRYVDANGRPIPLGTPFPLPGGGDTARRDSAGRLVDTLGKTVYRYRDLDRSFLSAALYEVADLASPTADRTFGLLHGAGALLGPRQVRTKSFTDAASGRSRTLQYNGFDTAQSPLLDLLHGYLSILADPQAATALTVAYKLLDEHEAETARLVAAMLDVADRGKSHGEAKIPATSNLYDDLVPFILRILSIPGLAEDLMLALEDPHAKGLGPMLARQAVYKDRFVLDQSTQKVSGGYSTPVDYGTPDRDWNRSVLQRMAHLVHDANNAQFCNKDNAQVALLGIPLSTYGTCELFEIDDLALFFILSIADRRIVDDTSRPETRREASFREHIKPAALKLAIPDNLVGDGVLQTMTGIDGFTRFPTPAAEARSLFLETAHQSDFMRDTTAPVLCNEGDRFLDVHDDSIFAWEATLPNNPSGYSGDDFYDALRPVVNAFAKHDECVARDGGGRCTKVRNAAKIFVDIMAMLHTHWGSARSTYFGLGYQSQNPNGPRYSTGDGLVTYERLLGEVLGSADLMPALIGIAPVLNHLELDPLTHELARAHLIETARYLFDPARAPARLAYRSGRTTTVKSDGQSRGPRVTPYYLLADAYAARRAALNAAGIERREGWQEATSRLVDRTLDTEVVGGRYRLKNRRFKAMTLELIRFLRDRIADHAGDVDRWVFEELDGDVERLLSGPVFAAVVDVVGRIEANPVAKRDLYEFLSYLVDPTGTGALSQSALTAVADQLQMFLDDPDLVPITRLIGRAADRQDGVAEAALRMIGRARKLDPNCPQVGEAGRRCALSTVIANLYRAVGGVTPGARVGDVLSEIQRSRPGSGGALDDADFSSIFSNVGHFLGDEQRGFTRFVRIVQHRRYRP